jgi:tripartite-type tricarboxylate transporter receptor subunit TctC
MNRRNFLGAVLAGAAEHSNASTRILQYPSRPIRLAVGFSPGGPTDLVARLLAVGVAEEYNHAVVVENIPGANGLIAGRSVAHATADGYTVLYGTSALAISPAVYRTLGFNPAVDLLPLVATATIPLILVTTPSTGAQSLQDFVHLARAPSARLAFGSAGLGNVTHLAALLFNRHAQISAIHVPYKGSAPALADLVAGHTQYMTDTLNSSLQLILSGKLVPLAILGPKRSPLLPNVPSITEAGYGDLHVSAWQGLFIPAGSPPEAADKLANMVCRVMGKESIVKRLREQGGEPLNLTSVAFAEFFQKEITQWKIFAQEEGIRAE